MHKVWKEETHQKEEFSNHTVCQSNTFFLNWPFFIDGKVFWMCTHFARVFCNFPHFAQRVLLFKREVACTHCSTHLSDCLDITSKQLHMLRKSLRWKKRPCVVKDFFEMPKHVLCFFGDWGGIAFPGVVTRQYFTVPSRHHWGRSDPSLQCWKNLFYILKTCSA